MNKMKNNKMIFILIVILIIHMSPVYSDTVSYCLNTSTLQTNITQDITANGNLTSVSIVENTFCPYNCSSESRTCNNTTSNNEYQVPMILGLLGASIVFMIAGLFGKALWMRILMTFSSLMSLIVQASILMNIATFQGQTFIFTTLTGYYTLAVIISITVLALFFVNMLWDYADMMGKLPQWAKNMNKKKAETLED